MAVQTTGFHDYVLEHRRPDCHLIMTGDRFEWMIRFLEASPILVYDTETSGLDWFRDARACGVAFGGISGTEAHQFYVPFRHRTGEQQLDIERISPAIRQLLASAKFKIGHHLKFDKHISHREGWKIAPPVYDTMVAAKLYDENRFIALKTRAVEDLGREDAKVGERRVAMMVAQLAKQQKMGISEYRSRYGYSQVPIWLLGEYACGDVEFTRLLWQFYEDPQRSISQRFPRIWATEMDLIDVLCDAEEAGIAIDVEYLSRLRQELRDHLAQIEAEIRLLFDGRKLELGSDAAVRRFLLEELRCPLTKLTRGGKSGEKQFAVDKEVLAEFAHVHPVVPRIVAWREAEKLANTYTSSILDRIDSRNYLHPEFQQVGTTSGRLSCSSPNFQNQPVDDDERAKRYSGKSLEEGGVDPWSIRRAYVVGRPGCARLFFDYCLAPETLVETVAGKRPLGDLQAGDKVYTYRDGKIAWGAVTRSVRVGFLPAYRVTFDNGESVVASADHRWPIRVRRPGKGGPLAEEIRTTSELQVGDRMIPMKRVQANYVHLYSRGATLYTKEHLLVAEAVLGPCPADYVVHHIDEDKSNNHFSNLKYVPRGAHFSVHGRANYQKQDHIKRLAALRVGLADRRNYAGAGNPNFGKQKGAPVECACCGKVFYRPPSHAAKFCSQKCYFQAKRDGNNHRVVAIEFLGDREMAAITVEPDHNFVLGCGVVTCNSQIELRVLAFYTRDPILVDAYLKGEDIHTRTSQEVFGTADKAWRRKAKVVNFGLSYCMTEYGFSRQAKIPVDEARAYLEKFFQRYKGIMDFRRAFWTQVRVQHGYFANLFGRPRRVTGISSADDYKRGQAEREAIASLVQGTAAELTKESLVRIARFFKERSLPAQIVSTVHDEIQIDCDSRALPEVVLGVKALMEAFPEFAPIPIKVDGDYSATSWADKRKLPKE
jgi:DNA polymerase I-like protein with 3'-5' exonuclease and polymerase domains